MRIVLVNVNTSHEITLRLQGFAQQAARPGTEVIALTPSFGSVSVESRFEAALATVGVLDCVLGYTEQFDAVVLAGFGEPGREGLQELLAVPVVDITDAATHLASLVAPNFSIVTTVPRAVSQIAERLALSGLRERCASIRPTNLAVLDLETNADEAFGVVLHEAERAIEEDAAESICLGCADMSGMTAELAAALPVPVVDGVAAAIGLVETLVHLGLSTSKLTTYAPPDPDKRLLGWPLGGSSTVAPEPALSRGSGTFTNWDETEMPGPR